MLCLWGGGGSFYLLFYHLMRMPVIKDGILWVCLRPIVDSSLAEVEYSFGVVALPFWDNRVIQCLIVEYRRMERRSLHFFFIFFCDANDFKKKKKR